MHASAPVDPSPPGAGDAESELFRTLFAAYPDALLVVDAAGIVVLANPSAASLLGYAGDELVGLPVDALVPHSVRPRHAEFRASFARDPRPRPMGMQMDLVALRKDGSEVRVEIALSPLQDRGLPLVVAAIRDIGAYPRVRQALQRAQNSERLAQVGRLAVDADDTQVLLDEVTVAAAEALHAEAVTVYLLESNRLELRVAGVFGSGGEAVGQLLPNRPDTAPGAVLAQGRSLVVEDHATDSRFAESPRYLEAGLSSALAVPLSDRGRTIGAVVVRASAGRLFGEDEVRFLESLANLLATALQRAQSEEALNHAARLESVGQLTGGIAHDFNNLLTVIQGNLQVLEELPALAGDGFARQLVDAAARASRRGAELTGKLLAFSRRQVLQPDAVDVAALIVSLADMLRRTLDQRIAIEVDVEASCPPVLADPSQLEAALLNIAINARDAMGDGGRLVFRAGTPETLPSAIAGELDEVHASGTGFVAVAIADTGAGMSDEVKERAFEPFFTTKAPGRGTGLGLSTVYGFVKQSKGAIAIDSAPGAGTTITLYIPQAAEPGAARQGAVPGQQSLPAGLHVLLVEDDAEVCAVVRRFFEDAGSEVVTAASGEQGLVALDSGRRFDLLVSDIALGAGMRGTELAGRAQALWPGIHVLLMSGYSEELLQADRDSPPAWELLRKPFTREELARAISRVLAAAR